MRRDKHIRLIIRADGTCMVDAMNFTDATCTRATQEITRALAGRTTHERLKPEARLRQKHAQGHAEGAR